MNIAVFGWYHHQNAGDDRIQHCLTRWLDGHTLAFLPAGRRPPLHMLRTYDAAILGGGGLLMRRGGMFRHMAHWVRAAGIPVALVGVSLEGSDVSLVRELRDFLDVCAFAWFRDRGSLEVVGEHPKAFVAPDVTWLYPYDEVSTRGEGVAVSLATHVYLDRRVWKRSLAELPGPLHPWPLYFERGGDRSLLEEVIPGSTLPDEPTLEPARRSFGVISSRYHGLLFALQLGRPVLSVGDQPKIRRFLADHALHRWWLPADRPRRLPRAWASLIEQEEELRQEIRQLRRRLHVEVWEKTAPHRDELVARAAALPPPARRWKARLRRLADLGIARP